MWKGDLSAGSAKRPGPPAFAGVDPRHGGSLASGRGRPAGRRSRGAPLADVSKRVFDIVVSFLLLLALLPALLLIAVAIRLDSPGPALFRQLRVGHRGKLFMILKFRSMHDAQADLLAHCQTQRGDKRITRVGRVLRRVSLDELPQLLNVLSGDMSLVGPRPHAPGTSVKGVPIDQLVPNYPLRHAIRPGLTGAAQLGGHRGALTSFDQLRARIEADLEYIERRTLRLDIGIIAMTVVKELSGRAREQPGATGKALLDPLPTRRPV